MYLRELRYKLNLIYTENVKSNGRNCEIKSELVYKHIMDTGASITKKQCHLKNFHSTTIQKYQRAVVKAQKLADVRQLLNIHFGDQ